MLTPAAWGALLSSDPAYHDLSEIVPDCLRGSICIHDRHPGRLFSGKRQKSPAHRSMKTFLLTIQPILLSTIGSPPGQAHWDREVEHESEIRCQPAGCDFVGGPQPLKIKAARESLIGKRGIEKSVA